jgi:hypothetical protein
MQIYGNSGVNTLADGAVGKHAVSQIMQPYIFLL